MEKKLAEEMAKGLPAPGYLLYGIDFLVEEAVEKIVHMYFPSGPDDFNCHVFRASSDSAEDIVTAAVTLPFMAERRLVLVKEATAFKAADVKPFERYYHDPSPQTLLVFLSSTYDKRSVLLKLLADHRCGMFHLDVSESQVPAWVRQRAADLGIRLSADAHALLLDLVGPDVALLAKELEKLSLAGSRDVGVEQVEAAVGNVREYTPFAIVEAIRSRNLERALRIMKALRDSGQEAVGLLGIIGWHYRQLYKRERNRAEFREVFRALHRTDLDLKSSGKPEWIVLESLLFQLMQG